MDILLETYYILLPIIATALVGWVVFLLKDQKKNNDLQKKEVEEKEKKIAMIRQANSEGIKLVLRYMLNRYHTEYMLQKKMSYGQYKDWMEIFEAYRALGGNSIAMDWNDDIEKLEKCNHMNRPTMFESMIKHTMGSTTEEETKFE